MRLICGAFSTFAELLSVMVIECQLRPAAVVKREAGDMIFSAGARGQVSITTEASTMEVSHPQCQHELAFRRASDKGTVAFGCEG